MVCAVSKGLMVTKDRVSDELGGICGSPSPLIATNEPESDEPSESASATESTASVEGTGLRRILQEDTEDDETEDTETEPETPSE